MRIGKGMIVGIGAGVAIVGLVPVAALSLMPHGPKPDAMEGEDFYAIRREALSLFPRGSRLKDAADQMKAIGFRCNPVAHKLANINAESLQCESHGRGPITSPTLNVTFLARNGLVSDIEIWNMLEKADASTPPPPPAVKKAEPAAADAKHAAGE